MRCFVILILKTDRWYIKWKYKVKIWKTAYSIYPPVPFCFHIHRQEILMQKTNHLGFGLIKLYISGLNYTFHSSLTKNGNFYRNSF